MEAFSAGALDWICTIEPYGTALLNDVKGADKLSDGTDIYGKGYTDCVLARAQRPDQGRTRRRVKALIKGMMKAQAVAESDPQDRPEQARRHLLQDLDEQRPARHGPKQPSVVDARNQTQFILDRTDSLTEMGYIKKKPGRDAIDWTLLEQVIAENQELYAKLKLQVGLSVMAIDLAAPPPSAHGRRDAPVRSAPGAARRAASHALQRTGWMLVSVGLFAGLWELLWAFGIADAKLLPPPHIFLGNLPEQAKFFNTAQRWQIGVGHEQPARAPPMAVLITMVASTARVLAGLLIAATLSIAVGVAIRYFVLFERLDPADHHAAGAGLADRLAAGRDLHLRHRQRAGDLHGGHRAVLPHGPLDHQPDRRCQPELHQRRADHGRDQAADLSRG